MTKMLTYQKRNLDNINKLADHTKVAALKWHDYLVKNKIDILIYETIRTKAQQEENVRKGASQTMKSYHLVGQALDFVPIVNGDIDWNGYSRPEIKEALKEAKRLGFEWGGDWKTFVDKPHLQFNYKGYGTDVFDKWTEPKPKPIAKKEPEKVNVITGWYYEGSPGLAELEKFLKSKGWHYKKERA
ncbi:M15 family metallopeptidase [Neobacillus drentensis]|uniref:M15 family metallopeptidase n=1 Tax=Neobacillus drentensis TaxID=220684 RepID=UPI003B589E50